MSKEFFFQIGNDNGNSHQKIMIDDLLITQPNCYSRIDHFPKIEGNKESLISSLLDNLIVGIESSSLSVQNGTYLIGSYSLRSTAPKINMQVGYDNKYEIDLPIVNTLGNIAGYAVQKAFNETGDLPKEIKCRVDMVTALPVTQFTNETANAFSKRFMSDTHTVTVYLGLEKVKVSVKFDFVKTLPEGSTVPMALTNSFDGDYRQDDVFDEFAKKYSLGKVNGKALENAFVFGVDIGDGTTEYMITQGGVVKKEYLQDAGSNNGIGHAIEQACISYAKRVKRPSVSRQEFTEIYTDPGHKFNHWTLETIATAKEQQSIQIFNEVRKRLSEVADKVDILCVYGGGSISMREYLEPKLEKLAEELLIKIFYVPSEHATTLNAEGLKHFVHHPAFQAFKKDAGVEV